MPMNCACSFGSAQYEPSPEYSNCSSVPGMRAAEVVTRISDFSRRQATVTIRTSKGGITRVLPYGGSPTEHPQPVLPPGTYGIPHSGAGAQRFSGISVRGPVQYINHTTLQRSVSQTSLPAPFGIASPFITASTAGNLVRLQLPIACLPGHHPAAHLRYASITLRDVPSPLDFFVDGHKGLNNPLGKYGCYPAV